MKAVKIISSWIGITVLQVGAFLPIIDSYTVEQRATIDLLKSAILINPDLAEKPSIPSLYIKVIWSHKFRHHLHSKQEFFQRITREIG